MVHNHRVRPSRWALPATDNLTDSHFVVVSNPDAEGLPISVGGAVAYSIRPAQVAFRRGTSASAVNRGRGHAGAGSTLSTRGP